MVLRHGAALIYRKLLSIEACIRQESTKSHKLAIVDRGTTQISCAGRRREDLYIQSERQMEYLAKHLASKRVDQYWRLFQADKIVAHRSDPTYPSCDRNWSSRNQYL